MKRSIAFLFDFFLIWLTTFAIGMLLVGLIPGIPAKWIFYGLFITYSILFDYYQHGTPGKHIMKIKIVYGYKKRSYLLTIFYRNFLRIIFFLEAAVLLFVPHKQGLHNKIAKCMIVEDVDVKKEKLAITN
ncbi:MAG: RDD family protein [Cyclobacteriaceae bacterium]